VVVCQLGMGLGWPEDLVVVQSNPEGGFCPREYWWGRKGQGMAKPTSVLGCRGVTWGRLRGKSKGAGVFGALAAGIVTWGVVAADNGVALGKGGLL